MLKLRDLFGLTIVIITHDLDLLWQVVDRVAVLGDGKVQATGSMAQLSKLDNPVVRHFFDGPRGRAAGQETPPAPAGHQSRSQPGSTATNTEAASKPK